MKYRIIFALTLLLTVAGANAQPDQRDPYLKLLGTDAPSAYATRVVLITDDLEAINIVHFDTIQFVSGNESFTWCFNGVSTLSEIDLNRVAPPGMLNHLVKVFIAKSPKDMDGAH